MAERPADEISGASRASAAETLQQAATVLEDEAAGTPPAALLPWPDRIRASASALCLAGLRIRAALGDDARFARLTDPSDATGQAATAVREFDALLVAALQALVDVTGYDNPDQEYPDLTPWFEFRCTNVVYGRHTDTLGVTGPRPGEPPHP